jgi:hypothetical protein
MAVHKKRINARAKQAGPEQPVRPKQLAHTPQLLAPAVMKKPVKLANRVIRPIRNVKQKQYRVDIRKINVAMDIRKPEHFYLEQQHITSAQQRIARNIKQVAEKVIIKHKVA